MSYLRGQERLVYDSVNDYLVSQLTTLGWFQAAAPYGATGPVTLLDYVPDKTTKLAQNTIAFTAGAELADEERELGASTGGLWSTPHVFFIDVYGESQGIAKAITSDIKAVLTGRLAGTSRYINVMDKSVVPAVAAVGHKIHFEDVVVEAPTNQVFQRTWRVVKVTAHHLYNATEYGVQAIGF